MLNDATVVFDSCMWRFGLKINYIFTRIKPFVTSIRIRTKKRRGSLIDLIAPLASLIARSCDRFFLQALMDLLGA
jgi:hypothetical protein